MRLLLPFVVLAGCYNDPTESSADVRERYLDRHAETFVLPDRTRTLDALRVTLAEEGYALVETEHPDRFTSDTKQASRYARRQLSIHLLRLVSGAHVIQIMELERDDKDVVSAKKQRADLEWLVVQRADPDRALALMRKANERADKVPPVTRKK